MTRRPRPVRWLTPKFIGAARAAIAVSVVTAAGVAACTGPTYDTRAPFAAEPPEVYVAKVKDLLVGLPPTDAEVAAVVASPDALPGLVDQWMATPEYRAKMLVFFELAFQQTQISPANFVDIMPRGLPVDRDAALLVQDARESLARTVLELDAEGRPLTDAFTTHRVMMTTALLQLYAYFEAAPADDAGAIDDRFARANPGVTITVEAAAGPISPAASATPGDPDYLHYYDPQLATVSFPVAGCKGVDPITVPLSSRNLLDLFYGSIPAHKVGTIACPIRGNTTPQLAASDFTDWRMVTIRPPATGEAVTSFIDLPHLRTATELVARTPRVGFFSTPAFAANWPTNQSNQMRVTLNQALIVATGAQIDGTDGTQPPSTPGLDAAHAAPGTVCYGCHQLLDPTRSILSSSFSWFYNPQTDATLAGQHGLFAFQHVVAPVASLDDFAQVLAGHPLVPEAWAQKLCFYVNSAPCAPDDPELQRIVADFTASNLSWATLVRELVTSPIVTEAAPTRTYAAEHEVVAVARRDHLCAQLDHRLGFVDLCQLDAADQAVRSTVGLIVAGLPSDGYGRGSTTPVLPNQPTLFYRAGVENICAAVSAQVIDAPVDPRQPGARHWSSGQPDAAIADFVALLLGLTTGDARAAPARDALAAHFHAATAAGASATDALRSTFVAACLSPSFIGIGL